MPRQILEREQELAALGLAAREAQAGAGSIVLLAATRRAVELELLEPAGTP